MKWSSVNFDWNQVRAFVTTAREGSFSAASRALNLTQPTLSRQVSGLEDALDVMLFERGKRTMELTEDGTALLPHAERMLEHALNLTLSAEGRATTLTGEVTITATSLYAVYYVPRVIAHLRDLAPDLSLEVIASNSLQDLTRREADIAIRHVRPTQEELVGKLISEHEAGLYASKTYLDRHGRPKTLEEAAQHDLIGFDDDDGSLGFYHEIGIKADPSRLRVRSGHGEVILAFAKQGLGLCILPCAQADALEGMERVLREEISIPFPVWLVTHREIRTSPRIRLVYDALSKVL